MNLAELIQRLAVLESKVGRLEAKSATSHAPLLAQLNTPRDVRLIKTVEVPQAAEGEEYPKRDDSPVPNVFPFRFVDAYFKHADQFGNEDIEATNRSTDEAEPFYGRTVDDSYLPLGWVGLALWQRGLQPEDGETEEDEPYGEWWILGPGEIFVAVQTTDVHPKGDTQDVAVVVDGEVTEELFECLNDFHDLEDEKFAIAAKVDGVYRLIAGDCEESA